MNRIQKKRPSSYFIFINFHLQKVCKEVEVESHKSIIKQARVQHLYGRFLGTLHSEVDEVGFFSLNLCICNLFGCVRRSMMFQHLLSSRADLIFYFVESDVQHVQAQVSHISRFLLHVFLLKYYVERNNLVVHGAACVYVKRDNLIVEN